MKQKIFRVEQMFAGRAAHTLRAIAGANAVDGLKRELATIVTPLPATSEI